MSANNSERTKSRRDYVRFTPKSGHSRHSAFAKKKDRLAATLYRSIYFETNASNRDLAPQATSSSQEFHT
jgi:hypothetical protein